MRKVGVAQEIAGVIQDRASWQEHRLQVWFERGEILGLKSCQEPIGAMVGFQSLGSGRVTRNHQRVGRVGSIPTSAGIRPRFSPLPMLLLLVKNTAEQVQGRAGTDGRQVGTRAL